MTNLQRDRHGLHYVSVCVMELIAKVLPLIAFGPPVKGPQSGRCAVRGLVAAVFAVFGLGALVIGLLIALATVIGPWLATIVVAGTLFVIALILALSAKARFTRAMAVVFPEDGADGAS